MALANTFYELLVFGDFGKPMSSNLVPFIS